MKTKWYISTFIIVFTLLGICHTNISLPNQEIIVEFNDDKVTNDQSQNAIASIKQQLQDFGVDNIQVRQVSNGNFRIVYHSSVAVESIKMALSSSENITKDISSFNLNHQKQSSDNNQKHYNLDVYEIQGISVDFDLTGSLTLETKYVYDRLVNSIDYSNVVDVNETIGDETLQIDFKRNRAIVLTIENTSHAIPEVRAGPNSFSGNL
jgi:hypothetical protein